MITKAVPNTASVDSRVSGPIQSRIGANMNLGSTPISPDTDIKTPAPGYFRLQLLLIKSKNHGMGPDNGVVTFPLGDCDMF